MDCHYILQCLVVLCRLRKHTQCGLSCVLLLTEFKVYDVSAGSVHF